MKSLLGSLMLAAALFASIPAGADPAASPPPRSMAKPARASLLTPQSARPSGISLLPPHLSNSTGDFIELNVDTPTELSSISDMRGRSYTYPPDQSRTYVYRQPFLPLLQIPTSNTP